MYKFNISIYNIYLLKRNTNFQTLVIEVTILADYKTSILSQFYLAECKSN